MAEEQKNIGFSIPVDTGIPERLQKIAEKTGVSVNQLIVTALREKLSREGYLKQNK